MAGTEPHAWGTGRMDDITYVGLDVHKATVCVAVAESGRGGEVRQIGVFENRPEIVKFLIGKGANMNALAPNGYTPLMLAARGNHLEAATVLLKEDVDLYVKGPKGETALSIANERDGKELAGLLRHAGAIH